jgi:hypothetical protein
MVGAALFGAIGLTYLLLGGFGLAAGAVQTIGRGGIGDLVLRVDDAGLFWFWIVAYALAGAAFLSIGVWMFFGARKTRAAERRFLQSLNRRGEIVSVISGETQGIVNREELAELTRDFAPVEVLDRLAESGSADKGN